MAWVPGHWVDVLRELGYQPGEVLGSGVEGTVIALGDDSVAKIWSNRVATELERLKTFYDAVADACPLATPTIHRVLTVDGQSASVESRLHGETLRQEAAGTSPVMTSQRVLAVLEVLDALASVEPTPALAVLPILEGEPAFDAERVPFGDSLAKLVQRRVDAFRPSLTAALPDLEQLTAAVVDGLSALRPARMGLVHGDLVPGNILVSNKTRRVSAILDFGFLSTVGDLAFDAAVAASIHDMYGPDSRKTEAALENAIQARFDYDPERAALYRAAYALTTSNCFSVSGTDGHFNWCVHMLRRSDVREALGH
jgi:aminoglycoside phosphotransferase (APT) family kinase protein